jgi:hypothetical protein
MTQVVAPGRASTPLAEVADNFVGLMRSFQRAKARYMAEASHDVEWSAQVVLRLLAHERRADPEDGRASILALTSKADAVIAEHQRVRLAHFATMLSDWDEHDLSQFALMLRRFTDDFEKSNATLVSAPTGAAEGNQ